ncbi:MAG TPA: hypothetical protein VGY57_15725 [Vicinamibacterales bacterium]|jgi:hypothetical protein|nr:hypothetical protein [Vicinamibacterales bacterium]
MKKWIAALAIVCAVAASTAIGHAHKAVTSKYTYNDDVFPIFREKCTPCHVEGGVAPMSLMTYELAYPWAESIRAELIASHMPPWNADEGVGAFKHARRLTAKEVDIILTWATGGNPKGQIDQKVPDVPLTNDWTLGAPDLKLPLPSTFTLDENAMEATQEFTLSTGLTEPRWVRAADLLPGTPSIVRSATIYAKDPAVAATNGPAPDRAIAQWVPGQDAEPAAGGAAFRLPAGAQIGVRIHYKKTWQFEGKRLSDRSTVGLYFSGEKTDQELIALPIAAPANAVPKDQTIAFSHAIAQDVDALALVPEQVPPNIVLTAEAVLPNGSRTPIIRLNTRADWVRRYWFAKPIALPRGSRIDVVARLEDPDLLSSAFSVSPPKAPAAGPILLRLDVVPARGGAVAQ